ncbi:MAG: ATP-dependent DNA helicase RecG, partial [Acutalibacteraceae bacterium]
QRCLYESSFLAILFYNLSMKELTTTQTCYSKFIVNCLDDNSATNCGKCSNCLGYEIISSDISQEYYDIAIKYIERLILPITPRKMWPVGSVYGNKKIRFLNEEGICLSKYGDAGYGELVKQDKYSRSETFCDELVGKSTKTLKPIVEKENIQAVTCVPSLRSNIVKDFSVRLAERLNLPFYDLLNKTQANQQKSMENSTHQCNNALNSFSVKKGVLIPESVLLVDDVVDSGWTLTVCGYYLMESGCQKVYPFTLSDSSQREG